MKTASGITLPPTASPLGTASFADGIALGAWLDEPGTTKSLQSDRSPLPESSASSSAGLFLRSGVTDVLESSFIVSLLSGTTFLSSATGFGASGIPAACTPSSLLPVIPGLSFSSFFPCSLINFLSRYSCIFVSASSSLFLPSGVFFISALILSLHLLLCGLGAIWAALLLHPSQPSVKPICLNSSFEIYAVLGRSSFLAGLVSGICIGTSGSSWIRTGMCRPGLDGSGLCGVPFISKI